MEQPRPKTRLFVQGLIRTCHSRGWPAFQAVRGDPDSGTVYLKLNGLGNGFVVLAPVRDGEGNPAWLRGTGQEPVDEQTADAYLDQQRRFDRDLWVVEIETRTLEAPVSAPML